MLFSVIITTYNDDEFISNTVLSAVTQSFEDLPYEIIIIDDASTDDTYDILMALNSKYDNIQIVRNSTGLGIGACRNIAVNMAQGTYLAFLDAGDLLKSDALEAYYTIVKRKNTDIIYTDMFEINLYGEQVSIVTHDCKIFHLGAALYRKKFFQQHQIKFSNGYIFCDLNFIFACAQSAINVYIIHGCSYYHRVGYSHCCLSGELIEQEIFVLESFYDHICGQTPNCHLAEWRDAVLNRALQFKVNTSSNPIVASALLQHFYNKIIASSKALEFFSGDFIENLLITPIPAIPLKWDPIVTVEIWPQLMEAATDAVIFMPNHVGHIRHFTLIANKLQSLGIKSVFFDTGPAITIPARRTTSKDLPNFPYFAFEQLSHCPVVASARAYVFALDWGFYHDFIAACKPLGVPTIALYEGINNDYMTQEKVIRSLPYRNVDYLLLPGEYYTKIYNKRNSTVVGLPTLHKLIKETVHLPKSHKILININFNSTLDGADWWPELFINTVLGACQDACIPFISTLHPNFLVFARYNGQIERLSPSQNSFYDDIMQCSLLISRFSTCILESLALGKPVIYHNPHGEDIPKFQENPMGAYIVTTTQAQLTSAIHKTIKEIESGVDFRKKASDFLHFHGHIFAECTPEEYAASAIQDFLTGEAKNFHHSLRYCTMHGLAHPTLPVHFLAAGSTVVAAARAIGLKRWEKWNIKKDVLHVEKRNSGKVAVKPFLKMMLIRFQKIWKHLFIRRKLQKRMQNEYALLSASSLFDSDYYLRKNPDVAKSGMDPLLHFIKHGWKEKRNPSAIFDVVSYLEAYQDVHAAGMNPLVHYIKYGKAEGRKLPWTDFQKK